MTQSLTGVPRPAHEEILLGLSEIEYQQWRHGPITAAYLKYMGDFLEVARNLAADVVEYGQVVTDEQRAAICIASGKIQAIRDLHGLALGDIQNFYRRNDEGDAEE